ncbi:MAG: cytochrome P450 [Actinomycetota bacterium]|nr:cytochrome P450 [Actinomycetota bacterium]
MEAGVGSEAIEPSGWPAFDPFELTDTVLGDVRDPYPALADLRRQAPVHEGPLPMPGAAEPRLHGTPQFTVYGHDEVVRVLRDHETFSSSIYHDVMGMVMGRTILEMDEPEHRMKRALVSPAFRSRVLARWETGLVTSVVEGLIDRFAGNGRADLVRELLFDFPVQVIARILGLPMEDYARFQRWSIELLSVMANFERGMAASRQLAEYFSGILEERRRSPSQDLISDLASAEVDGERLGDEEVFAFLRLLLPAGVETTYRASGNLLFGLLSHPDQLGAVCRDLSLLPQAFEEALRWEPPLTILLRIATTDTELGGVEIPAGAHIGVCVAAANRDERRYQAADSFDIFRDPRQHVTFGFGVHMCLGMHLARMETRVAVSKLFQRVEGMCLDPGDLDPHIHGMAFRSPTALPVTFSAVRSSGD